MWVRTTYGIGQSVSADQGASWSPVEPSRVPHPTSRFFLRRLRSGTILLVKNGPMHTRTGRSDLTPFLSNDEGQSWTGGLLLDGRARVSYPDGAQAPDGTIHLVYDRDRTGAREILMARFTEDNVLRGTCGSQGSVLRMLINEATGDSPTGAEGMKTSH